MIFVLGGFYKKAAPFRLVGQVGLEPTMVKPADLQSTAIAARRLTRIWWNRLELNQRRPDFQSGALPAELRFHVG